MFSGSVGNELDLDDDNCREKSKNSGRKISEPISNSNVHGDLATWLFGGNVGIHGTHKMFKSENKNVYWLKQNP